MVDRLPEFQGPKYRGSFRRGDFVDFHQRFSLVPRRCAGKYPPAGEHSAVRCVDHLEVTVRPLLGARHHPCVTRHAPSASGHYS